jgi:hypothetical protein
MIGFDGGAIGADIYCDRTGILCRTLADCAKVLDALKDPEEGYYDPRDPFTTVPRSSVLATPYASHTQASGAPGSLKGVRLGVIRESMLIPAGSKTEEPIVTAASAEIKSVLGGKLGATLVESSDPLWTPDPAIERMKTDYRRALAQLVPVFMPDLLFRLGRDGLPLFKEFAAAIVPTEFAPGKTFGSGKTTPIDYCVALAEGTIVPPGNLDLATIQQQELAMAFRFHISQYLTRRAADWRERGFDESLADWASLNARSKFWGDDQRAAFKNWEEVADPRNPLGGRQGVNERIMLRELLRRADMMVIIENKLDALVRLRHPEQPCARIAVGPECRPDRGAGAGRLCDRRVRSGVRFEPGRHAVRVAAIDHAHDASRAWTAVLAGVSRRAGPGGCAAAGGIRLRGGLAAPHSAAAVRAFAVAIVISGRERSSRTPAVGDGVPFPRQAHSLFLATPSSAPSLTQRAISRFIRAPNSAGPSSPASSPALMILAWASLAM